MRKVIKTFLFVGFVVFVCAVDLSDINAPELTFVNNAEAIIGAPRTPMSYAGVARRSVRRGGVAVAVAPLPPTVVVVNTPASAAATPVTTVPVGTVVQALPSGCSSVTVSGVSYSDCGGAFYKTAFQGNKLVYVVVEKPMK